MRCWCGWVLIGVVAACTLYSGRSSADEPAAAPGESYSAAVLADEPVAYWRFTGAEPVASRVPGQPELVAAVHGELRLGEPGPRSKGFPLFEADNPAASLAGKGFLRVADPGPASLLDFANGHAITLEAWVNVHHLSDDQHVYVVGKGRTGREGFAAENQNYALRLTGVDGTARVSLLFRSAAGEGKPAEFHRWTAASGFLPGTGWHHVAVSYRFGEPESVVGYFDGQAVGGRWDMGGPTARPPVVDDDELWIGSALGGNRGNTFPGAIDEVAIYRRIVPVESLARRFVARDGRPSLEELLRDVPSGTVSVAIREGLPSHDRWDFEPPPVAMQFEQPQMAFVDLPRKYGPGGIIVDWQRPMLATARVRRVVDGGQYVFLLRSRGGARLWVDGQVVAQTPFARPGGDGHEPVPDLPADDHRHPLPLGHRERVVRVTLSPGEHVFSLEAIVGAKNLRPEIGECCVAWGTAEKEFVLLAADAADERPLTDAGWRQFADESRQRLAEFNAELRRQAEPAVADYWQRRRETVRAELAAWPSPTVPPATFDSVRNEIDHFLNARLQAAGMAPSESLDDLEFLRRLALDTVGVIPAPGEVHAFLNDPPDQRRRRAIDRYLNDPRWADHWVSYWQDVLAENPGILKPQQNNTGPFRWWIYEALLDNKPLDRFVTELVMMEGSTYDGGPAGFAMATQNDVPLADKAHVLARAFLAVDMTCARCHDAPLHPWTQEQLFQMAAMLQRQPIRLPASSSVPIVEGGRVPAVTVSLKPGASVAPQWPLAELVPPELPQGFLDRPDDPRQQVAGLLTSPRSRRFAQVMANRIWARLMGRGLVEPLDDWYEAEASHPELLDWLAYQLAADGYDAKALARRILNSHAYQRRPVVGEAAAMFAGPTRRRMTAEQLVDSLFALSGKPIGAEMLTLDPEGRRPIESFLNLGQPRRAWQFTSLSNERDRPALALPVAQSVVDLLQVFGWRDARPNPRSVRDSEPTVLQPLTLAHGTVGLRATQLSEDSQWTALALQEHSLEDFVDEMFLRVLTRRPLPEERAAFVSALAAGFANRRLPEDAVVPAAPRRRPTAVSWSNHLSAEATEIKLELERLARAGDPPSPRLLASWRESAEDALWALINSPEFVFVP